MCEGKNLRNLMRFRMFVFFFTFLLCFCVVFSFLFLAFYSMFFHVLSFSFSFSPFPIFLHFSFFQSSEQTPKLDFWVSVDGERGGGRG